MANPSVENLFAGDGEIAALMRSQVALAQEESDNELRPFLRDAETWSSSLKNAFAILLNSDCPMFLVWDFDPLPSCDRILFYNDAYLALLNETQPAASFGRSISDSWTASWSPIQTDVEQVFTTGQPLRREQVPFPPDRSDQTPQLLYSWSYTALWNEVGQIGGVFATGCQTTANNLQAVQPAQSQQTQQVQSSLQQTQAALQESEARFQAFMRHSPTSAWIADPEGRLLYLSPIYSQMFQFSQKDAVGKQIHDIYSQEFAQEFLENNRRVFETGQVIETVEKAPRPDGSIGNFLVYKFPITQASQETLLGGVAIDITEYKRTEERLRHREEELRVITNALPALIAYVDKDHCYRFNNQTYEVWFGQPVASYTGRHLRDVLGDAAYNTVLPYIEQALSGQRVNFESKISYREGGNRYIQADYVPRINSQGEVEGYFSLITDISDRKRAESERNQAEAALREKEQQLQQLSDSMPQFVWICNAVGELEYVNQQWTKFSGLTLEQTHDPALMGALYHPDDRQLAYEQWAIALETQQTYEVEARLRRAADGDYQWFLIRAVPVFNEQGQVHRWYGTSTDIHKRKRRELHDQFLNQLDIRLRQLSDVQAVMWETVSSLGEYLELSRCTFVEIDWQRGLAIVERDWCRDVPSVAGTCSISDFTTPDFQATMAAGQAALVYDVTTDPRTAAFAHNYEAFETRAFANAPCIHQGCWVADLTISSKTPRVWRDDEVSLLQETGARVWPLIEQTRAVQALRESEERFRISQELSLDAFTVLDSVRDETGAIANFVWTYINPKATEILQSSADALIGQRLLDILPGNRSNRELFERYTQVVETGEPHDIELFYDAGDVTGWFRNMAVKLGDGVAVFVSDISDRKRSEQALIESETLARTRAEELTALMEITPAAIWIARDPECHHMTANLSAYQLMRIEPGAETTATPEDGSYPLPFTICRNGQEVLLHDLPMQKAIRTNQAVTDELEFVFEDGTVQTIYGKAVPLYDSTGGIRGTIAAFVDISDRRRIEEDLRTSEERLRFAIEGAALGTWEYDLPTSQIVWSDQAKLMFWVPPDTEVDYERFMLALHPDDRDRIHTAVERAIEQQEPYDVEMRSLRSDNAIHWIRSLGRARYDQNGIATRMVGVVFDITDRKQTEMALAAQEQRYRHIFEAVNISIWEEDFSEVKAAIDQLKANGVQDFHQYFIEHPEFVRQMIGKVYVRDVNQASLQLFGAQTKAELLNSLHQVFTPESQDAFIGELLTIAAEETHFSEETVMQTLQGDRRHVWFTITFPPTSEPYDRVLVSVLDMSDRKRAEAALRQSEQQLRLAQQSAGAGMWDWDMTTNMVAWSEEYYQLYGLDPAVTPSYENWLASIWEPDRAQVDQVVRDALKYRTNLNVEFRVLHPIKGMCWLTAIGQTFYNVQGHPIRMTGIALNITARKQAEEALRNSAERLGVALAAAKLGDWSWAASTDIVTFSDYAAELFGIPPGPHMTWTQMQSLIHVDDRENARRQVERAILEHGDYDVEYRVIQSDQTERWITAKGRAQYDLAGQVLGMLGVVQDITPRKQAEVEREQLLAREQSAKETLQRFIEHTPVAVVMLDRDMRYLFASQRWMQEYAPAYTDLKGLSHYEVMMDVPERWRQVHQRCLAGKTEACEADYYLRADGTALWLRWEILPWYAGDEIGGIIIFAENITERKQAAQERDMLLAREQEARRDAEQANRIKDEFLAVLSHELRSPLNPILGWAKLLQTRQFDAQGTTRALETIERNAKLQAQLIDDLLDVSRILRGKMILNVCEINLVTVIDAAIETVRLSAEAKSIAIHKTIADDIGLILGDSGRLQQVIWNLLSNAVKFTPIGGTIEVKLATVVGHRSASETSTSSPFPVPHYAQIQVIDTGKGITPEFLPYVFDYFRQEDGTTTRKFGGLGLGLAIVRYLTELHGGTVQAESSGEGLGAIFTVNLPLKGHEKVVDGEHDGIPATPPVSLQPPLAGLRILIVDDEPDMRELIFTILEHTGAETTIAASAREALNELDNVKPDILISDIGMPEMDGYALMRQVRRLPPERGGDILAIALTAYAGEGDQHQALSAGFQQHIAKPIEPEALVSAIITLAKS